jgi:hypothetical protein
MESVGMLRARRTLVCAPLAVCAALAVLTAACGGGTPASPTAIGPSTAIAATRPGPEAVPVGVTTTWSCFAASVTGPFASSACGGPVVIGAQSIHNLAGTPSTPSGLQFTIAGSTVTLTWSYLSGQNPDASSYVVEAGSAPGLTDLTSFDTGNAAQSLTVTGVPGGTYFVRVRARASDRTLGAASNEVILTVGGGPTACTSVPGAPSGLSGATNGSTVNLAWTAPSGGCAATAYILEAGSAPGSSNLANFNTGSTATQYSAAGVAAGTYYVRVRAANSAGNSAASNEVIVTVGGSTPTGVSGTWIGLVANGDGTSLNSSDCGLEKSDWQLDLTQTGSTVTGTLTQKTVVSGCDSPGLVRTGTVSGTVNAGTFSFTLSNNPSRTGTATFTASRMTGSTTFAGTFALNRQ